MGGGGVCGEGDQATCSSKFGRGSASMGARVMRSMGGLTNRLWRMDESEQRKKSKRGLAAARLHLSQAAEDRGQASSLIAMVCGQVKITLKM